MATIQRKLERWELTHLRALAASLHERLERTEAELAEARARIEDAWADADMWRDQAQNLIEDLQSAGREVGLTQTGQLVTIPKAAPADNGYEVREGCAA